jgi:hypothetical protein
MSQEVENLSDKLEVILEDLLGAYTLPNGDERPAISIFPPQPRNNREVSGLEMIIDRTPDVETNFCTGGVIYKTYYNIVLAHHDTDGSTREATKEISNHFVVAKITNLPKSEFTDEQTVIRVLWPDS